MNCRFVSAQYVNLIEFGRYKGDLKVHLKRKHGGQEGMLDVISKPRSTKDGKSFPCLMPDCNCGYARRRDLLRHFRNKHPNAPKNIRVAIDKLARDDEDEPLGGAPRPANKGDVLVEDLDDVIPGYVIMQ